MNAHLFWSVLLLAGGALCWGESAPAGGNVPEDALDHNYTVNFRVLQGGTNAVQVQTITARRSFQLSLERPAIKVSGKLYIHPDNKAYLEYEFGVMNLPDAPDKRGAKSQANNQMFASLVAFVVKSTLTYDPQQNEANTNGSSLRPPTSARGAVRLQLGRPITLMRTDRELFQISVDRNKEGE